jgi:hypothetical protein
MTSQLALMNHLGVALASDSVVTMNKKGRTYSTVNKIFSLAGRQPIAIMVSDSANYIPGDVAWERVIGQFREHMGLKELPELSDYVTELRQFVSSSPILNDRSIWSSISLRKSYQSRLPEKK